MKKIIYVIAASLLISLPFTCIAKTIEEESENKQLAHSEKYFKAHVLSIKVYDPINVKIKTDGKITNKNGQTEFLLHIGEACIAIQDHHSSLTYMMRSISKGVVTFKYESKFDHRSFGKKISIDRGEFYVPF